MSACEKCWSDCNGDSTRYLEMLNRVPTCTPEEQAGPGAGQCHHCRRQTLHQHTGEPMCGCPL